MSRGAFPPAVRAAVFDRDGGCVGCGSWQSPTVQHRRARGMGGSSLDSTRSPANGLWLCGSGTTGCHGWTEDHPTLATALGWRVDPREDPATIPVWTTTPLGKSWSYLTDDGFAEWAPDPGRDDAVAAFLDHLNRRTT